MNIGRAVGKSGEVGLLGAIGPELAQLLVVGLWASTFIVTKHAFAELIESGRKLRELEKRADQIYRRTISELFADEAVDAKELLRQKEVLEDIERAIDHCDGVADVLANLAVKHG